MAPPGEDARVQVGTGQARPGNGYSDRASAFGREILPHRAGVAAVPERGVGRFSDIGTDVIVDHILYWMPCASEEEGAYLLALINSDALRDAVEPHMSRGHWGARDLHKHLWNLAIPRFDPDDQLPGAVAAAGEAAALGAAEQLPDRAGLDSATARRLVRQ